MKVCHVALTLSAPNPAKTTANDEHKKYQENGKPERSAKRNAASQARLLAGHSATESAEVPDTELDEES